jgi:septal ring factor EnvC (AmiA/AmiB activator)
MDAVDRLLRSRRDLRGLPRSGPPTLRAQIVLMVSAFLVGAVAAGLLFVGIWRHTAAQGDAATAAATATKRDLSHARDRLASARADLAAAEANVKTLARERAGLNARLVAYQSRLQAARAATAASATAVRRDAASAARQAAQLRSEIRTLGSYLATTPDTDIDSGYLATQVQYLAKALDAVGASVAALGNDAASHP